MSNVTIQKRGKYYQYKFEIAKVYGKDWEQNKVTNVEEITQTKEKNETEATLENTKITEGITNKAEDTKATEKLHKEKIKQDEKFNQELEKLENEKKKLQRKLAKTKIPKTFYIPTSKFEDLNNYFINKGRNILNYPFKIIHKELGIKDCRFYDLRGSYATTNLRNGVEIRDVADVLGHKDIETTENYYISSTDETRRNVTDSYENSINLDVIDEIIEHKISI